MREAGWAREGSEAIADLPVKCEQHPGWCSGFWPLQMGGSGTHSWPRRPLGGGMMCSVVDPLNVKHLVRCLEGSRMLTLGAGERSTCIGVGVISAQRWQVKMWEPRADL